MDYNKITNHKVVIVISLLSLFLLLGGCPLPLNVAICGNGMCETGENSVCPTDCDSDPDDPLNQKPDQTKGNPAQMCQTLGGDSCQSEETCAGYWLDESYLCCSAVCDPAITEIYFQDGWNYVSFPAVQLQDPIENIFSAGLLSAVDSIYTYDNGAWKVWHSDPSIPHDLEIIEGGRAYIFVMNSQYTLQLSEIESTLQAYMLTESSLRPPLELEVKQGWNLIGVASEDEEPHEDYLWSIAGNYESLWMFATTQGDLEKIDLMHNYNLIPTHAYWIYLSADGEITP